MRTLDLRQQTVTIDELVQMASQEGLFILTKEGRELVLTEADNSEDEVVELGESEKFMQFLAKRSKNKRGRSLNEVEKALGLV